MAYPDGYATFCHVTNWVAAGGIEDGLCRNAIKKTFLQRYLFCRLLVYYIYILKNIKTIPCLIKKRSIFTPENIESPNSFPAWKIPIIHVPTIITHQFTVFCNMPDGISGRWKTFAIGPVLPPRRDLPAAHPHHQWHSDKRDSEILMQPPAGPTALARKNGERNSEPRSCDSLFDLLSQSILPPK